MNKRSFAIVALSTICLATILAAVPTNSLVGYYDPWLDYNDDGNIDMKDVAASARAFSSYGDPTKNVNVMNWPVTEQCVVWWNEPLEPADSRHSDEYQSRGFSQLHILLLVDGLTLGEKNVLLYSRNNVECNSHRRTLPLLSLRLLYLEQRHSHLPDTCSKPNIQLLDIHR